MFDLFPSFGGLLRIPSTSPSFCFFGGLLSPCVPAQLAGHWERGQLLLLSTCGLVCYMPVKWFAEFITLYEILLVLLHGKHIIFLELVIIY